MTMYKYTIINIEESLAIAEIETNEAIPHLSVGVEFFVSSDHWPNQSTQHRLQEVINIRLVHPEWSAKKKQVEVLVYCKGKDETFPT